MADSLLDLAGVPGGTPPPENQAVLDQIAGLRRNWERDVANYAGNGLLQYGPFSPGVNAEIAMQPGMSGYFDVQPGGSIIPRMQSPQQAAQQAGVSLGQLAGSMFPGGSSNGQINYNIPKDASGQPMDRGGFFSLQDLYGYGQRPGGQPVPVIGTEGATLPSTNNWRLLGRGPGWIMRNGRMIYTRGPEVGRGAFIGANMGGTASAESGIPYGRSDVGTGAWAGMPNTWLGAAGWPGQDRPYNYDRWPAQTNV